MPDRDMQAIMDRIVALLDEDPINYSVFLKVYKTPATDEDDIRDLIRMMVGEDAVLGKHTDVLPDDVLSQIDSALRYAGDAGAGPGRSTMISAPFTEAMAELGNAISRLAREASTIESFQLDDGHPSYTVFWEFAFLFRENGTATVIIGSSSD